MTLPEVMMAAVIFTIVAVSLTAALIQNYRIARSESYRTQVINCTMGVVEQLRARSFTDLEEIYKNYTTETYLVQIIDPLNFTAGKDADDRDIPAGYRQFKLPINVRDGVVVKSDWTTVDVPLDTDGKLRLNLRYWLDVKLNLSVSGNKCDVYEARLVYQWRKPGDTTSPWQSGAFRVAVPWLNPTLDSAGS